MALNGKWIWFQFKALLSAYLLFISLILVSV
uniref:Uncharacterized protein n=1 Tax=Rhizophora mucronata TaxID=61149 RepID=A0A2P2PCF4_RHIMU